MAGTGTTRDRVWGSVTDERDKAFMATVALFPHGQLWYYAHDIGAWCAEAVAFLGTEAVYTCTASSEDPPTWTPPTSHSHTLRSVLPRS